LRQLRVNALYERANIYGGSGVNEHALKVRHFQANRLAQTTGLDMVEAGWSIVTQVLDVWKALPPRNFPNYPAGVWGPKESDELLEREGRRWRNFVK